MENSLRWQLQHQICEALPDHRSNEGPTLADIMESGFDGFRNMNDQLILDMFMYYFEDPAEADCTELFDEVHRTVEYQAWRRANPKEADSHYRITFDVHKEGTVPGALGNKVLSALEDCGIEALRLECKVVE